MAVTFAGIIFGYDPNSDTGFSLDYGETFIQLVRHNQNVSTIIGNATVPLFTAANLNVVYNTTTKIIYVYMDGSQIISRSLTNTEFMDGKWSGIEVDRLRLDTWDEFCWTPTAVTFTAGSLVRVTRFAAEVPITGLSARVTRFAAEVVIS